jgi:hypothetical protein
MSRRRDNLSFNHHTEVASLPAAEADALLDWVEKPIRENGKPCNATPCNAISTMSLQGEEYVWNAFEAERFLYRFAVNLK